MDEQGCALSIKDRMNTAEYNNFLIYSNALIHSYEDGRRLQSKLYDQRGSSLVDLNRAIEFSKLITQHGIVYTELDEKLRLAIEYFGLQEFFGGPVGGFSVDSGKTEIVVPDGENDQTIFDNGPESLFKKVKRFLRK